MPNQKPQRGPREGSRIVWPKGLEARFGVSAITRWRWEKSGKLPPRDVFIGGLAKGWRPETLAAAERAA